MVASSKKQQAVQLSASIDEVKVGNALSNPHATLSHGMRLFNSSQELDVEVCLRAGSR
jgi:hypothetical protein